MNEDEIASLTKNGIYRGEPLNGELEETHISWVILTKEHVFKLKKPVKLSFLDFSTLNLRNKYCEREVMLNSRFTDIYEAVVPVYHYDDLWYLAEGNGKIVDYAVQMKRLATARRMDNMLRQNKVRTGDVSILAHQVAAFHKNADKIYRPFELSTARALFNDIGNCINLVEKEIGPAGAETIEQSIKWSDNFLNHHAGRFQDRIDTGLVRDVHGDLHSGNVFIYKKPVIFDCIEFNDQYRQIDVLYEVAFMCMDLEAFHHPQLAEVFLKSYSNNFPCFEVNEDEAIFRYFKCLRANVRAKVQALSIGQSHKEREVRGHIRKVEKYINLMKGYMRQ
ncbi:hypothetical protein LVD17_20420 [Fulvivirga ulvae]|uniref:hypothetical protein n=1 Tax=Fulvivirga ulvae TaxID=2904245 RepID=UPI001F35963D|nr:hypothetical protein [Fulvivirga ulvae]UII30661.1 hypothetical protein LVD17_20420 [Fulvivirga ulvae]